MSFWKRGKLKIMKQQIALFNANDNAVALRFSADLCDLGEESFDVDEIAEDLFALFFVYDDKADYNGDYEKSVEMASELDPEELSMKGIFNFKVQRGEIQGLNR